jgi:hypothetical protein
MNLKRMSRRRSFLSSSLLRNFLPKKKLRHCFRQAYYLLRCFEKKR